MLVRFAGAHGGAHERLQEDPRPVDFGEPSRLRSRSRSTWRSRTAPRSRSSTSSTFRPPMRGWTSRHAPACSDAGCSAGGARLHAREGEGRAPGRHAVTWRGGSVAGDGRRDRTHPDLVVVGNTGARGRARLPRQRGRKDCQGVAGSGAELPPTWMTERPPKRRQP